MSLIARGDRIPYRPPSEVSPGDVVVLGDTVTVSEQRIAAGARGSLELHGEYELPRASVFVNWPAGTRVNFDTINRNITTTNLPTNVHAGVVTVYSHRTDKRVRVMLLPG